MERLGDWFKRAETQLDDWGRPAWIATVVLGFIAFGPFGLIILGYAVWRNKMGCRNWKSRRANAYRETGNVAFDQYRRETLERLETEREAFVDFLAKLREAKDRAEFEQFMKDRETAPA